MTPYWLWWSAGPGTVFIAWYLAWRHTQTRQYALFAGCYLVSYLAVFCMAGFFGALSSFYAGNLFVELLEMIPLLLFAGIWGGGYLHVRSEFPEIRLRLRYAAAARTSQWKKDVLGLEDRIRLEYGFTPLTTAPEPPPMTSSGRGQPDHLDLDIIAAMEEHRQNQSKADTLARQILARNQNRAQNQAGHHRTPFQPSPRFPPLKSDDAKINLNTADRDVLAEAPEIGMTLALEIVRERDGSGPYRSFDDFCLRCRIKPHVRINLEKRVVVETENLREKTQRETGKTTRTGKRHRRVD